MTTKINTFTLKDRDIDLTLRNKKIAYTFQHGGKNYGYSITLTSTKQMDIMNATFLLLINALETIELLDHEQHTTRTEA